MILAAWCSGLPLSARGQSTNTPTPTNRAPAASPPSKPGSKPARPDFAAFKIISDKNIFNPHRLGPSITRREAPRRFARVDSFALVGTMIYEKGPHAFFEGSGAEYTKVAKPSDTIAGYTVSEIQSSGVKLTAGTNVVDLPVGMQMSRQDGGEWLRSARPEPVYVSRGERGSDYQRGGQRTVETTGVPTTADSGAPEGQGATIMINGESITLPFSPDNLPPGFPLPNIQVLTTPPTATPTGAPATSPAPGGPDDVLARLRARAAAERGDQP